MATYIKLQSGKFISQPAVSSSAGVADADKILSTNGAGQLDVSFIPASVIGSETVITGEALTAGNYVNIQNNGSGGFQAVKADASLQREAHGFVLQSYASGASATIYFEGSNTAVTGQSPGKVYLTTVGNGSSVIPTVSGHILQNIGFAVSATRVNFESNLPIIIETFTPTQEEPESEPNVTDDELRDLYHTLKEKLHEIED